MTTQVIKQDEVGRIATTAARLQGNIEQVIVGKGDIVVLCLVAILSEGHLLIEDVPGTGKTVLAKAMARSLGCTFRRIQGTPDLLPTDITGTYVFNQQSAEFEFRPGPIMSQVLLVDEINRATPRTQSALLEAMQERQVTVEGETKTLMPPFLVMATQNPVELEGTFPLPEAQLDRFLMQVNMGYPSQEEDKLILRRFRKEDPLNQLEAVVQSTELLELQELVRKIHVSEPVEDYLINLVHATRSHPMVELGASPRAMLALYRTSQGIAAIRGRAYVIPDDVKALAEYVLAHRVVPKVQSQLRGTSARDILRDVINSVPVPVEEEAWPE
ncbi:MAG: MoxR family ATPase [Chloroflexota bacterium]|nr:MoxR family ATPase [Chloroflexota bacterium]